MFQFQSHYICRCKMKTVLLVHYSSFYCCIISTGIYMRLHLHCLYLDKTKMYLSAVLCKNTQDLTAMKVVQGYPSMAIRLKGCSEY